MKSWHLDNSENKLSYYFLFQSFQIVNWRKIARKRSIFVKLVSTTEIFVFELNWRCTLLEIDQSKVNTVRYSNLQKIFILFSDSRRSHHVHPEPQVLNREDAGWLWSTQIVCYVIKIGQYIWFIFSIFNSCWQVDRFLFVPDLLHTSQLRIQN